MTQPQQQHMLFKRNATVDGWGMLAFNRYRCARKNVKIASRKKLSYWQLRWLLILYGQTLNGRRYWWAFSCIAALAINEAVTTLLRSYDRRCGRSEDVDIYPSCRLVWRPFEYCTDLQNRWWSFSNCQIKWGESRSYDLRQQSLNLSSLQGER
jgi:hypothetical protein